jgi:gamma-glutamyltranspeptidase/glutathione hydrolase
MRMDFMGLARALARLALVLALAGTASGVPAQQAPSSNEGGSAIAPARRAVQASRHMVAAANPVAASAGREILRQGGSALDAAIAIQMVLTLVEPQSSGIGGGAFLVHYDATSRRIVTYDGRETAPARMGPDWFMGEDGKPMPFARASVGGHAVGVPGVLRMLELAHREHGRLPWARNFGPAIALAHDGFQVGPRLHRLVASTPQLREHDATRAYFFDRDANPVAAGARLVNDDLAETLRQIANGGADAFYGGSIARDVVAAAESVGARPGLLSLADLAAYRAVRRDAVCGAYRTRQVCGMGPPSSGAIAIAQALGMLERFDLAALAPGSPEAVHLISEATRLAFADRNRFVGDPDHVTVPVAGLLEPDYLAARARLIDPLRRLPQALPGEPRHARLDPFPPGLHDTAPEMPATSHVSVVDGSGNAVAMTTSIENAFGSRVFVRGFLLNNQLTDFAFDPTDGQRVVANAVAGGKRPRSSMSPTIVTDAAGELLLTLGSPGGARIIPFVLQTLVAHLDWGLDIQQAISLARHATTGGAIEIERETSLAATVAEALRARGHMVAEVELVSGLQGISVRRDGDAARLSGGADPRREGDAVGD